MTKKEKTNFSFIRYANCWEDTQIMLAGLEIKKGQKGAIICSGGDNALALLATSAEKVFAFDFNKTQLYCTELKIAAIKMLSLKGVRQFLGVDSCSDRKLIYQSLRSSMSDEAVKYFDENLGLIEKGIIHCGKFEKYFHIFRKKVIPLVAGRKRFEHFAEIETIDAQKDYFYRKIYTKRFKALFKIYFGAKVMGRLGRDKSFYRYVDEKKESGRDIQQRVEYGLVHTLNRDNPYCNYIIYGNYVTAVPEYLKKKNFETIKKNINKIELVCGDLRALPKQKYNFLYLSDIFEYMSEEEFEKNVKYISEILDKGARIMYWNMQNRRYIEKDDFELLEKQSSDLYKQNNAWFYRDLLIYRYKK